MNFYQRMYIVCSRIPRGKVATYGQIALLCGSPNNSRQVGYALRTGRVEECADELADGMSAAGGYPRRDAVPAHRIVNSRGILSGAKMFETYDTQKRLLEAEGVRVEETAEGWRVDLRKYGWQNSLDEAEELYAIFSRE